MASGCVICNSPEALPVINILCLSGNVIEVFAKPGDANLQCKQTSGEPVSRRRHDAGSGDEQGFQLGPAKSAGCYVLNRHVNDPVDSAVWSYSDNAAAAKAAIP